MILFVHDQILPRPVGGRGFNQRIDALVGGGFRRETDRYRAVGGQIAHRKDVAVLRQRCGAFGRNGCAFRIIAGVRDRNDRTPRNGNAAPRRVVRNGADRVGRNDSAAAARRLIIRGRVLSEQQPCVFGIIDKDVAVALHVFALVVAGHLPGVDRVVFHPLQQRLERLDDLFAVVRAVAGSDHGIRNVLIEVRLLPAAPDVEQDARDVALDVFADLDAIGARAVPQHSLAAVRFRFV